jgi:puromycin-sensitive aminopeptidase
VKKLKTYRLPTHIIPERYTLTLEPDLNRHTFLGTVEIVLTCTKPTREITLHAVELALSSAVAVCKGSAHTATRISASPSAETVTLTFPEVLRGTITLSISYTGTLNDKMHGFYRSTYTAHGKEHTMAVTQFESTFARYALPCIDEPAAKAVFQLSVVVEPNLTALSNTHEAESAVLPDGRLKVTFHPTPKMSTYLLACIIGLFESIEKKSARGTTVRVFVTRGKEHQAHFALDVATRCLDFYESYFKIPYPLQTLDNIAIPDFAAGAMENWGAITYRETALLYDPDESSAQNKQRVALVIAHELAHQWFGNLVTMEWWTDLWLNEGFANYIEYLAIDALFPEWDIWTQFVHVDANEAMRLDALNATHPIEIEVHHPSEVNEIFDAVSYAKGATVIRMLAEYVGARDFQKGLREYLTRHAYGNARTKDLWAALERASGKPVRKIMAGWTLQPGYPVVTLARSATAVTLTQTRYFSSMAHTKPGLERWSIPMHLQNGTQKQKPSLLSTARATLPVKKQVPWVNANRDAIGMYRTNYDSASLFTLTAALTSGALTPRDRIRIVSDAFTLGFSGDAPISDALTLATAFKTETDYSVWAALLSELDILLTLVEGTPGEKPLQHFIRALILPLKAKVGWAPKPKESHTAQLLRGLVWSTLVRTNDAESIAECVHRFAAHEKGTRVPPDVRPAVYAAYIKNGGAKEIKNLLRLYESETLHAEKTRILVALGVATRVVDLRSVLRFSLSQRVRSQDTRWTFLSAARSMRGAHVAWEVITEHWDVINTRFGKSGHDLPRFVHCASLLSTEEDYTAVRDFFKTHNATGATRAVEQTLESIRSRILWRKKHAAGTAAWLTEWERTTRT